jgi:Amidohydrolase
VQIAAGLNAGPDRGGGLGDDRGARLGAGQERLSGRAPARHKILFESDYPHADTPWPHTQAVVKELFRDVDQETTDKITYKNAEELFKFPMTVPG